MGYFVVLIGAPLAAFYALTSGELGAAAVFAGVFVLGLVGILGRLRRT